jgi:SOS regulatory protein LexA
MTIPKAIKLIRKFYNNNKRLPSYQELSDLLGFSSKKSAYTWAAKLIEKGILAKDEAGKLIPLNLFPAIPVLGSIQAGFPQLEEGHLWQKIHIDQMLIRDPENSYILQVSGDSMINAGIFDQDLVIIEKTKSPKIGDIVVAQIDDEFTLKYYQKEEDRVVLVPANKNYPKLYPQASLVIFGTVVSVIRKYH